MRFFIIFLFLVTSFLFAKNNKPTLMLQVNGKNIKVIEDVKLVIRMGVEEVLTQNGYILVSESIQKIAMTEMKKQNNSDCLDDACLVDTGGMLAAKGIFVVDIVKLGKRYIFKVKHIDIETAAILNTKSMIYKYEIDNADDLLPFSKKVTSEMFAKKEVINKVTSKEKSESDDSCDTRNPKTCYILGDKYRYGDGFAKNIYKANSYYKKACDFNYGKACQILGENYTFGDGFIRDPYKGINLLDKAVKLFKKGCELNDVIECNNLAKHLLKNSRYRKLSLKDKNSILSLLTKSCNLNNKFGCEKLATLYSDSFIVSKDIKIANKFYKKACDLGSARKCYYLGELYEKENELTRDLEKAYFLYEKSCNLKLQKGCSKLKALAKTIYEEKKNSDLCKDINPKDCYEKAKKLDSKKKIKLANKIYKNACKMKYGEACNSLGYNYKYGVGVKKDLKKSNSYYEIACNLDDKYGCYNLGNTYLDAIGVKQDKHKAVEYYKKACKLGIKSDICKNFK